jgi:SAM-dependent methyltransferase
MSESDVTEKHGHSHDHSHAAGAPMTAQEWDERYLQSDRIWSGRPNDALVRHVEGLAPGRALDLGCGEGGDAVWLAARGWTVLGVDISQVALERAARHAAEAGVAERVEVRRVNLAEEFPDGRFDLVSAQFLHSRAEMPREPILRRAAAAVAVGGVLLVESHCGFPHGEDNPHPDVRFPPPAEVLEALDLTEGAWEVLVCEEHDRMQDDPAGQPTHRADNTVLARRIAEG